MVGRLVSTKQMRSHLWRVATLVSLVICAGVSTKSLAAQDEDLDARVRLWLETTCGLVEVNTAPLSPNAMGSASVPLFIQAFEVGPETSSIQLVRAAALRRYENIQQLLEQGKTFGLSQTDLAILRAQGRESYVDDSVTDFIFNYGDSALRALSVLGGTTSRDFLLTVATDSVSPHADTARRLLLETRE